MKRWALIVAGLYLLLLMIFTVPAVMAAFMPEQWPSWKEAGEVYLAWPYWVWLGVMGLSQFALLAVPVRVASRRPATKGSLWPTVLAAGLMAGLLVLGAGYSLLEFGFGPHSDQNGSLDVGNGALFAVLGLALASWVGWGILFFRMRRKVEPVDLVTRQCRWLFRGSILELLIAVPTHVVARYRDYCCAGFMTFIGLALGCSVMLFSFGPSVFVLFVDRWKRLHPRAAEALNQ